MKKITKVKDQPINGKIPNISISRQKYLKGLENLHMKIDMIRKQAKKEN